MKTFPCLVSLGQWSVKQSTELLVKTWMNSIQSYMIRKWDLDIKDILNLCIVSKAVPYWQWQFVERGCTFTVMKRLLTISETVAQQCSSEVRKYAVQPDHLRHKSHSRALACNIPNLEVNNHEHFLGRSTKLQSENDSNTIPDSPLRVFCWHFDKICTYSKNSQSLYFI